MMQVVDGLGANRPQLFLHEEILLLALRDEEGTAVCGPMYTQAMGGGILADLLLSERLELERVKKKDFIRMTDGCLPGDAVLDECVAMVGKAKRRATAQTWVSKFANLRELTHKTAESLCDLGVLKAETGKVLFIFNRRIYPEINALPEQDVLARLRVAIFEDGDVRDVEARTAVLLALAHHSGLLPHAFDKKALKKRKTRIEAVIAGDLVGDATKSAIQAIQAAVMVACVMPAIIVST